MKKGVKEPVISSLNDNNKLIILLLVLIVVMGVLTIVFYFSAPPQPSAVKLTMLPPQPIAQGAVSLQIINPPEDIQKDGQE